MFWLSSYKICEEDGNEIMEIAKEIAVKLGVNAKFSEKRRRENKRPDIEKAPDESYFFTDQQAFII